MTPSNQSSVSRARSTHSIVRAKTEILSYYIALERQHGVLQTSDVVVVVVVGWKCLESSLARERRPGPNGRARPLVRL